LLLLSFTAFMVHDLPRRLFLFLFACCSFSLPLPVFAVNRLLFLLAACLGDHCRRWLHARRARRREFSLVVILLLAVLPLSVVGVFGLVNGRMRK
jgi:hypothetical protein